MPTLDRQQLPLNDPDADLDGYTSGELEESLFGPDPDRPAPRREAKRPVRVAPATKFCHACGDVVDARAEICPHCGVRQPSGAGHSDKSRTTAALFAILACAMGGFGLHKFYLGRVGAGILSILFIWTGIPWLISVIDTVRLLTMTDRRFAELYG